MKFIKSMDHSRSITKPNNSGQEDHGIEITPWNVEGNLNKDENYQKLIEKFGTQQITIELLEKIKRITNDDIHPLLNENYFFSHRDLDWILNEYEKDNKFYLYTGRGPSGNVHMGHLLPWIFTSYLQKKFNVKLLFQLTDDEKFLYNDNLSREQIKQYTYENLLDIIAIGFDPDLTKIIVDSVHIKHLYPLANEISKKITFSTAKAVFGFGNDTNIGMIGFPPIQAVPCFLPSIIEKRQIPVLIPAAIDQDPYWRVTRDIAQKLGFLKPAQIHSKFLPSLSSLNKMSSSKPNDAVFTTDPIETIEKKICSSLTGGQPTIQLQKKLGANPDMCPVFTYLRFFFDSKKESLDRYYRCKTGNLMCGECKNQLANHTMDFMKKFQKRRDEARNNISKFMYNNEGLDI